MEGVQVDEESWEKLRRIMGKWKVRGGVNIGRGKKREWKGLAEARREKWRWRMGIW